MLHCKPNKSTLKWQGPQKQFNGGFNGLLQEFSLTPFFQ